MKEETVTAQWRSCVTSQQGDKAINLGQTGPVSLGAAHLPLIVFSLGTQVESQENIRHTQTEEQFTKAGAYGYILKSQCHKRQSLVRNFQITGQSHDT